MRTKTELRFRAPLHRVGVAFLAAALAGCAAGGAAFRDAERALERGDLEDGIAKLEQAVKEAPTNNLYRLELRSKRDEAVRALIAEADRARTTGEFDAALTAYRRVLVLESGNERAQRGSNSWIALDVIATPRPRPRRTSTPVGSTRLRRASAPCSPRIRVLRRPSRFAAGSTPPAAPTARRRDCGPGTTVR